MVPVSAHQKTGISELLEMILLVAEMQDLKANQVCLLMVRLLKRSLIKAAALSLLF